jgi:hypothetical protein
MKSLLLVLGFFSFSFLQAQHWSHVGTTWYYNFDANPSHGYMKMEHLSDTTVQHHDCDKMRRTYRFNNANFFVDEFFLYADADRVYMTYNSATSFYILYDFSLQPGDTLNCENGWYYTIIDSAGKMIVNGDTLRLLFPHGTFEGAIAERIGGLNYFFPYPLYGPLEPGFGLRCYNDPVDHWSYWTGIAPYCDYSAYSEPENDFQILPNPSDGNVNIVSLEIDERTVLHLYDSCGRLLTEAKGTDTHNAILHFPGATGAVYHVQIINGYRQIGKSFVNLTY